MALINKNLSLLLVLFCICSGLRLRAQNTVFLSEGKIEYEKRVNLYSRLDENNAWSDFDKKLLPNFMVSYFDLVFSQNKTLFKPGRENPDNNKMFWEQPGEDNVVYSDMEKRQGVSQKKVFDQLFNVQDSLRAIKWKLTDETRVIAGFNCRRANALIMDSIYVVAFYTDEIITPGGPESFTGLPGMILGVALPHQHITWFATKVQSIAVRETDVVSPIKGKKVDNATLSQTVQKLVKNWGKQGHMFLENILL
ncbi:MAG: GLPGLI family protein [Puia sp.]|nr:GLPGLI family protein [Puia sp.]